MKPSRERDVRALWLAIAGIVVVVALLGLFIWSLPKLGESGKVEVKLGSDTFDAGSAERRAEAIATDGPLLFSDVAGGERDIYVQHVGADAKAGWSAFDARRPGTSRACTLRWDRTAAQFTDPCGGPAVPADGAGLPHYPTEVNAEGHVIVILRPAGSTTTTTAVPETTSSIIVTGTRP